MSLLTALASQMRDPTCDHPSRIPDDRELLELQRSMVGARARISQFSASLSRLVVEIEPTESTPLLPHCSLIFVATQRIMAPVHFVVADVEFLIVDTDAESHNCIFHANGGDIRIVADSSLLILIQDQWPDVLRLVDTRTEQAGAGQPATRPESKSEGGDKPQPKSEGRSR
jgi:hypothetical protein